MLKPCLRSGALTRRAEGYCVDCQPSYSRRKQRSGGRQLTFRRKTLQTYGLRCMACGHPGSPDNPIEAAHDIALDMTPGQQASFEQAEKGVPLCRKGHRRLDAVARRGII
jgi:predicted restriction endonuclease